MEEFLVTAVGYLRMTIEAIGAAIVALGALMTTFRFVLSFFGLKEYTNSELRLYLGRYLVLGLEFQVGADILSTAISPTISDVELLAATVVIRTVLNYFLSRELERERREVAPRPEGDVLRSEAS
ncbi:MAG: DUF1622 domain-containing protein [Rubrobacter sp.]|nr:DUF1622 domain-containing protein [Rubrobacter sp.]